ncbi:unnamed protein product [Chrysoparadoxa australica]
MLVGLPLFCGILLQIFVPLSAFVSVLPCPSRFGQLPLSLDDMTSLEENRLDEEQFERGHMYGYGDPSHSPSILQKITTQRYQDVAQAKTEMQDEQLIAQIKEFDSKNGGPLDLFESNAAAMKGSAGIALAAEFKRASPSKGDIAVDVIAAEQGCKYASVGATVLSVLTEPKWFKGSLEDMRDVRLATQGLQLPSRAAVLRKDFVVDERMILEARAFGADTVLLIVAILEVTQLTKLIAFSREWGMEPLVEVHTNREMEIAIDAGAKVIGVNNRNLHTFKLDLATTERVALVASKRGITWGHGGAIQLAALSGITGPEDVERYRDMGVSMVLVGETLMRSPDPAKAIQSLLGTGATSLHAIKVVCGVTRKEDALVATAAGASMIGIIFVTKSPRCVSVAQAKEIVTAVQKFGERAAPKAFPLDTLPKPETATTAQWFTEWSKLLASAGKRTPLTVGVFQNQPTDEVRQIAKDVGLDLVQLHGDEPWEDCRECGVPTIRVIHVPADDAGSPKDRADSILQQLRPGYAAAVLLDTSVKGAKGGTGVGFDREVAKQVQDHGVPILVAGGITAGNVADVISETGAFGVDVSSGVEQAGKPGIKDHQAVIDYVHGASTCYYT